MPFISYAQNGEDVILWRALRHINSGFYIDVGAWDPRLDSVTLAFYERGWRGINIEPNNEKYGMLVEARPTDVNLNCAVSDQPGTRRFYDVPDTGLSTLDPEIAQRHLKAGLTVIERDIRVMTLAEICERHAGSVVHFLKVDVEGFEADVLASADFVHFRPWILVVEATEPNSTTSSQMRWEPMLLESSYEPVYFDGLNRYYVAQEQVAALAPSFVMPNIFDDYVSDAGVRKALEYQTGGLPIPALQRLIAEQQEAEARTAEALQDRNKFSDHAKAMGEELQRLEQTLRDTRDALELAEQQALAARRDSELAHADVARGLASAGNTNPLTIRSEELAPDYLHSPVEGQQQIYYDASLIVRFGFETPVGIIRTEHYVAEFLARRSSIDLRFVVFDVEKTSYRTLSQAEAKLLRHILFHRYNRDVAAPDLTFEESVDFDSITEKGLQLAHVPDPQALELVPEPLPVEALSIRLLLRKLKTASRLTPHDYNLMQTRYALDLLPIRHYHSPIRRLTTRCLRSIALRVGRALHAIAFISNVSLRCLLNAERILTRPDLERTGIDGRPSESPPSGEPLVTTVESSLTNVDLDIDDLESAPVTFRFPRGSVLLSLANSWDYLDYRYLHRTCKRDGLRFISIIYDVIGMELPFSTPSPPHIYHRHWVEIGHCAGALLAISKFSADQYDKHISKPNDLSPQLTHAPLPNFLRERSAEIGATPVASLAGKSFVMFCSTIETRKNHQLLLHLWDRLREAFAPEQLPILVFVGKWGWGAETVRLLSERNYRLRKYLQILDRVSDAELIWLYRNARFTVFPALSEGYGLAAAESLSFSTPVVVASCPALIEATEGLMPALDPLDIVGWFAELQALIRDDRRLDELRAAAARYRGPNYETFAEAIVKLALAAEPELEGVS